jgi:predicted transcriptional regulator
MAAKKQLGARIDSDLYRKIRVLAAQTDIKIADLIEEAIRDLLKKHTKRGG